MINKIIQWFIELIFDIIHFFQNILPQPERVLTLRGYYMYKYCKKIVNGEIDEFNKVSAYEEWLEEIVRETISTTGAHPDREIAAQLYIQMIEDINPILCEELTDIGITEL